MAHAHPQSACIVCKKQKPAAQMQSAAELRPSLARLIAVDHPDWGEDSHICRDDLMIYRQRLFTGLLADEAGELGRMEVRVAEALAKANC